MATIKKSNKKKIIIPIIVVLIIAIVGGSIFTVQKSKGVKQVTLSTITSDNIVETVSSTGEVSAGASREYKVGTIATCKEVFVKVGDEVQEGDVLATFDTEQLDAQIDSLEATYKDARASYNAALKNQAAAKKNLSAVNKKISSLEKQLKKAEKSKSNTTTKKKKKPAKETTTQRTTKPTTERTTIDFSWPEDDEDDTTTTTSLDPGTADPALPGTNVADAAIEIASSLSELTKTINDMAKDVQTTNAIVRVVMTAIANELVSGEFSKDAIADAVGDAMSQAIKEGIIDETKLIIDSGVAVEMVQSAVSSVDWKAVGKGFATTDNVQLASLELQLAALYAQKEMYSVEASSSVVNSQKKVMETSKSALDSMKKSQEELQVGWKASMDGIVTECTLEAGGQTTMLEAGIKIENLDKMIATISLGEYDVHKVKVGMQAEITTAYGSYTGEVATIAPTATGGSSGSMLDSVGSMAGISGLSSLTASGAGVECTVTIDNPDSNIIVGFDANVLIQTGAYNDVVVVPTESIVLEKDGSYVYKYDEAEGTVTKTKIETGAVSDTAYEVTSGLKVGDKIVSTPASDYEDDTFKVKIADKK